MKKNKAKTPKKFPTALQSRLLSDLEYKINDTIEQLYRLEEYQSKCHEIMQKLIKSGLKVSNFSSSLKKLPDFGYVGTSGLEQQLWDAEEMIEAIQDED